MRIALTGATGYLGSHLLGALIRAGHSVVVLKRSFSNLDRIKDLLPCCATFDLDKGDLIDLFHSQTVDAVIHSATNYGRGERDTLATVESNLVLPLRLLELGKQTGMRLFMNTDTILDKRVNSYSLSKSQFRDWLHAYSDDVVGCNVALEHFYGPGDDGTKFVSNVIRKFLEGEARLELTPGHQTRDFIFIDDVVDAMMTILASADKLCLGVHDFEIGSGNPLSIRHFVELIKELVGNCNTELAFGALPYRHNEVMTCNTNLAKIAELGWRAKRPLIEGLKVTIQYEKDGRTA